MNLISLENFDKTSDKEPILTSPRSIEACLRQGILQKDLINKSPDEVKVIFKEKDIDKATLDQRIKFIEERRLEKIKILIDERKNIIEEEKQGLWSVENSKHNRTGSLKDSGSGNSKKLFQSTLVETEKKQLEKIRLKQQKEIEQMIEYEVKMAEFRKTNEDKMLGQKEKEKERAKELVKKRQLQEELKRKEEFEKQRKLELELENQRKKTQVALEKEQDKQRLQKQKEIERIKEAKIKEELQKQKKDELKQQMEESYKNQQETLLQKKIEMEEKDKTRKKFLMEQQAQRLEEARLLREKHEDMLKLAKQKNDEDVQKKKEEYNTKQKSNEEKKLMFEKQREKKKDECKLISETKSQHLKEIINSNLALEEKRKEEYYAAQDQAAERKKKLDEQTEIEAEKKRLEDIEKEKQRKAVKEKFDKLLDDKKQFYLRKMGETDEKVINSQMRKTLDLKSKHNADVLKRFIKRDKVESMMRRQEWQRTMIMDKILNSSAKADNIKDERMNILEARQKLRDEISRDKKGIMEKFTKIKMGRLDPSAIYGEFNQTNPKTTQSLSPSAQIKNPIKNNNFKIQKAKIQQNQPLNQTQPLAKLSEKPPETIKTTKIEENEKPKVIKEETQIKTNMIGTEKEIKLKIDNLKMEQNHEMLLVLEEEQINESSREDQWRKSTDPKEKKKLESICAVKRSKAISRIQDMTKQHERNLDRMMTVLNLKS